MSKLDVHAYRQQLERLKARLTGEVSNLRGEALGQAKLEPDADLAMDPGALASHLTEEDRNMTLLGNEQHLLADVMNALERVEQGTFGMCEECHKPINAKRLEVVPYARFCVKCARARELAT
jgi:RNA polymerase-binding protein DksA